MKGRKGFTLIELLVVIAIIAVLAAILFPVFARARKAAQNSTCQSNLNQIGRAFKLYLSEWHDSYPSNRSGAPGSYSSSVLQNVQLTPAGQTNTDGTPKRFQYGLTWVEALYPYVEAISQGNSGAWLCPAASNAGQQRGGAQALTSAVSYTFNANLCEQPEGIIRNSANLMICRELDRKINSCLRPVNVSMDSGNAPAYAFLTTSDSGVNPNATNAKMHGMGSNMLFADGHVKGFGTEFMPSACQWDATDSQWYNFVTGSPKLAKTIAVSP